MSKQCLETLFAPPSLVPGLRGEVDPWDSERGSKALKKIVKGIAAELQQQRGVEVDTKDEEFHQPPQPSLF